MHYDKKDKILEAVVRVSLCAIGRVRGTGLGHSGLEVFVCLFV